jgi:hypothetical protein
MELVQLKTCQNQIIVIALAGAGVMLGLVNSQANPDNPLCNYLPFYFLSPLLILLPLWVIFYDKARTISRIIGFVINQEKLLLQNSTLGVTGWETAMEEYRQMKDYFDDQYKEDRIIYQFLRPAKSLSESIYWFIVYCVFLLLSLACLVMSILAFRISVAKNPSVDFNFLGGMAFFAVVLALALLMALREDGSRKFRKIKNFCIIAGVFLMVLGIAGPAFLLFRPAMSPLLFIWIVVAVGWTVSATLSLFHESTDDGTMGSPGHNDLWMSIFCVITIIFAILSVSVFSLQVSTLGFAYWAVLVVLWVSFAICAGITLWFFKNLVNGRYSYREFEWRWKKILMIRENKYGIFQEDPVAQRWPKTTLRIYSIIFARFRVP